MLKKVIIDGASARRYIRQGKLKESTSGIAVNYAQFNVVIIPSEFALDFEDFCQKNSKFCPIVEIMKDGMVEPKIAKGADIRVDVASYDVFKCGQLEQHSDISKFWSDDLWTFFLGCSFTFESALIDEGFDIRHISEVKNVPMYITDQKAISRGKFGGSKVVSMRPFKKRDISKVINVTQAYPKMHGAPLHYGDPSAIGIKNLSQPEFGESVNIQPDEVPVFWACGVTAREALKNSKIPMGITHTPGYMFISDAINSDFKSIDRQD